VKLSHLFPLLAVALGPPASASAHDEPAPPTSSIAAANHGAGGPFLGAVFLRDRDGHRCLALVSGGSGYSYHLGRLRLGGGGESSLTSATESDGRCSVGWGGLMVGWDLVQSERWELPVGLEIGGGRVSLETPLEAPETFERRSSVFMAVRASVGPELRLARTLKLSLTGGYMLGLQGGVALQAVEARLQLVFFIPRPGM